ncbi:MAG: hypothetical protein ACRDDX_09305 [Cellulosilyticaceae bacterium]
MKNTSFLYLLIKCIAIPLVVIKAISLLNILDYITFIPKDKAFDLCLIIYLAIAEVIWSKLEEHVRTQKVSIQCIGSIPGQKSTLKTIPVIHFVEDVATIKFDITINGSAKKAAKNSIIIPFPTCVDVQVENKNVSVDSKGVCTLDLRHIVNLNNEECVNTKYTFFASIIKNYSETEGYEDSIIPKVQYKSKAIFDKNSLKLE